jgi:hypothetical protein
MNTLNQLFHMFNSSANVGRFSNLPRIRETAAGFLTCPTFEAVVPDDTNWLHTDIQVTEDFILALTHR